MIRMLIVLLVVLGIMYKFLFVETEDEKPVLKYQKNLDQAENLEKQIFENAENRNQQIEDLSQ